jgi:hypothetical protein
MIPTRQYFRRKALNLTARRLVHFQYDRDWRADENVLNSWNSANF